MNVPETPRYRFPLLLVAVAGLIVSTASTIFLRGLPYRISNPTSFELATWIWISASIISAACFIKAANRANTRSWKILSWLGFSAAIAAFLLGGSNAPHSTSSPKHACINNLRQIDGAKEQFALENKLSAGARVTEIEVAQYLKGQTVPKCPSGGKYSLGKIDEPPGCSVRGHTL
jgi:hypothetical protein